MSRFAADRRGPLIEFIMEMNAKDRARAIAAIRSALTAPDGQILLQVLENATHGQLLPASSDPRALAAVMAQRFIPHDLRRIADADPDDPILAPSGAKPAPRPRE